MRSIAWVTFPMTLTDPNPVFKVTAFLKSNIGETARLRQSYYDNLYSPQQKESKRTISKQTNNNNNNIYIKEKIAQNVNNVTK